MVGTCKHCFTLFTVVDDIGTQLFEGQGFFFYFGDYVESHASCPVARTETDGVPFALNL